MKRQFFFGLIITTLLFISLSKSISGQEWTEPVNISNIGSLVSVDLNFVVDHKNVIHVVWDQRITDTYWVIMYSKSEDDGNTWSEPADLLGNKDYWMAQPQLASDSKNNLYVTYTHDYLGWTTEERLIKMLTYNGHQWSEPVVVSEAMPGSNYSSIIIDQNDNPFVFWLIGTQMGDIDLYYRYYKEGIWSDIFCPFCDSAFAYLPTSHSIDRNFMHWAGVYQTHMIEKPAYFKFTSEMNHWDNPEKISNDTILLYIDLSISDYEIPECAYRKKSETSLQTSDSTKYTKKNDSSWLNPELVSGANGIQQYQQIEIDQNNNAHIVERQNTNRGRGWFTIKNKVKFGLGNTSTLVIILFYQDYYSKETSSIACMERPGW